MANNALYNSPAHVDIVNDGYNLNPSYINITRDKIGYYLCT